MLAEPSSERQFIMYEALRKGADVETLHEKTHIKAWFIEQMKELVELEEKILQHRKGSACPTTCWSRPRRTASPTATWPSCWACRSGDPRAAQGAGRGRGLACRAGQRRRERGLLLLHLQRARRPSRSVSNPPKVMVLGGGPNRIGQGIEFDYCCVHAAFACATWASSRSWSTATRRPSRPTTTPPTSSTSSR
jgi:carbamoyl-phosphate synthase large subunit